MAFLSRSELESLGFKSLGANVKISDKASIYEPEKISIGDDSRIDDFCVVSGKVSIGRNVHIAVFCNVSGGDPGITLEDFSGLAYGCHVFAQSDDYSGKTMTNPTVPAEFKNEYKREVIIRKHSIVGAGSYVFPGVILEEGTAVGAMSLVSKSTDAWSIYAGTPAKKVKERDKGLLELEANYLSQNPVE